MRLTRRSMMAACAGAVSAGSAKAFGATAEASPLGLVIHSFPVHTSGDRGRAAADRFSAPGRFLEYARTLGAAGVQVGLGVLENAAADTLRERTLAASMYLEGIASLPRDGADVPRFEAEIRTARLSGAQVVRSVMLSGRRYETFSSIVEFRRFAESSAHSIKLAADVVAREGMLLAVENHKDWRADELIRILKQHGNDQVGVCLDTGNSISLLEDPMEVVEALAPRAFTTHFKDMAVEEYKDGFLLSEVPLGTGVLDLPRVIQVVRASRPGIRLNLEMITRDPLKVPCLGSGYWATFPDLPGKVVARALSFVREHPRAQPLPRISQLAREEQLRVEDENVRKCLEFARNRLGLAPFRSQVIGLASPR